MKPVTTNEPLQVKRIEELKEEDRQTRERKSLVGQAFFHPRNLSPKEKFEVSLTNSMPIVRENKEIIEELNNKSSYKKI